MEKEYIGDGVYAENDGFGIILTAENGVEATDTIYLEPAVFNRLVAYVSMCAKKTLSES